MTDLVSTEERNAILKARAVALAEQPAMERDRAGGLEVLEFRLASETYGIESSYVREVFPLKEFTPLPGTPAFVLGIMSVRGQVFSIFDLARFFDLSGQRETAPEQVIIVRSSDMEVAIPVDEIAGVRSMSLQDVRPTLPTLTGGPAEYLLGITGERLALLDVAKLLGDTRIIVSEEVG